MRGLRTHKGATIAALAVLVGVIPVDLSATDWYWVNDLGGTWDEEVGGVTSWRDPTDSAGIPATGDSGLLVLPYSFSFCNPDGSCFTQPVQVNYRSDTVATLNQLIIESNNLLFQGLLGDTTPSQLDLASLTETIGGSNYAFTPPPSFFFPPDSPGIYGVGQHVQNAGTNRVRDVLLIGARQAPNTEGIDPIEGTYELSGTGSLTVGRFGVGIEKIGAAGDGLFVQSGGSHIVDGTLIMAEQGGSTGTYRITGGSLAVETVEIVGSSGTAEFVQTGGTNETRRVVLGQQASGIGIYRLGGTGELVAGSATNVVAGKFVLEGGTLTTGRLVVEGNGLPLHETTSDGRAFELRDGILNVSGTTTVGDTSFGVLYQFGGLHVAERLVLGEHPGGAGQYRMLDGVLEVSGNLTVSRQELTSFLQYDGEVRIGSGSGLDSLVIGEDAYGKYELHDGLLEVTGREHIGLNHVGEFLQNGGRHVVQGTADGLTDGYLFMGERDIGSYTINGGELEADIVEIGRSGRFHQNNSSTSVDLSQLKIAATIVSGGLAEHDGAYFLEAGDLTVDSLRIGLAGRGLFQQTGGVSTVAGSVAVGSGYQGHYEQLEGFHFVHGDLDIGATAVSMGTYTLIDGTLEVVGSERVGEAGSGEFRQAPTIGGYYHSVEGELIVGAEPAARGAYYLTGSAAAATLTLTGTEIIGQFGEGTFDQAGGTHVVIGELIVGQETGSQGTYLLRGETDRSILEVRGDETVGRSGAGLFHQTGGTHSVDGHLNIGSNGPRAIYRLEAGLLDVNRAIVGAGAKPIGGGGDRFEHLGGTYRAEFLTVSGGGDSRAEYDFREGRLDVGSVLTVADGNGFAEFTQNGAGSHTVTETLRVGWGGSADGQYSLHAGTLEVHGSENIGDWAASSFPAIYASGRFVQDGASTEHQIDGLLRVGPDGTYTLSGGMLRSGAVEVAGSESSSQYGSFHQRGGNHSIDGTLRLQAARYVHPSGELDLSGRGGRYYLAGGSLFVDEDLVIEESVAFRDDFRLAGRLSLQGGSLIDVGSDSLHNHGIVEVSGSGVAAIRGTIRNDGLFDVLDTTVDFAGTFYNDGQYRSAVAASHFETLTVGAEGYLVAGGSDRFYVANDFLNSSQQANLWETDNAALVLSNGHHIIALPGEDRGDESAGRVDNFVWGALEVSTGSVVEFVDGNPENDAAALYVNVLNLDDPAQLDPKHLIVLPFSGDATIYYNSVLPENDYLRGLTYVFANGSGRLAPQVPAPTTLALMLAPFIFTCLPSCQRQRRQRR